MHDRKLFDCLMNTKDMVKLNFFQNRTKTTLWYGLWLTSSRNPNHIVLLLITDSHFDQGDKEAPFCRKY